MRTTTTRDRARSGSSIGLRVPTLLLSAIDDPFLPSDVLDEVRSDRDRKPIVSTLEFTEHGGHVGFVGGRVPWRPFYYAEWRACEFLSSALESANTLARGYIPRLGEYLGSNAFEMTLEANDLLLSRRVSSADCCSPFG